MRKLLSARLVWLVVGLGLLAVAVGRWSELGAWAFLFWLLAPDLFGLLPAALLGPAPERGALPRRGVPLYNIWHTFWAPLVVGGVVWLATGRPPEELLLGWLLHICLDRAVGYGLRQRDGRIGPVTVWA